MMSTQSKTGRRTFFAGLGAIAAAGVAAKLASRPSEPEAAAEPADPPGPGYRLTEHIKKYYHTTKI
jgi:hypothetical protein